MNGKHGRGLELYLNDNADKVTWKKIYDKVDAGDWGGDSPLRGFATRHAHHLGWPHRNIPLGQRHATWTSSG